MIEDGKARQQVVTLGAHQDNVIEIVDGLKGDRSARHEQRESARDRHEGPNRRGGRGHVSRRGDGRRPPGRPRRR